MRNEHCPRCGKWATFMFRLRWKRQYRCVCGKFFTRWFRMSIGIGGKIFGQGFEFFIGFKKYTHSLTIAKVSVLDYDDKMSFSLLSMEVAIRW